MAFPWRADNGPKLNAGLVALGFFQPYNFVIFQGVGGFQPPPPPPRACIYVISRKKI